MSAAQSSGWFDRPPEVEAILAVGSLILFSGALGFVLFDIIPAENEKYAMLMLGALIGIVKDTFGRYFQATKGAQEQRKEAAEVARTLADTAAVVATSAAATTASPDGTVSLAPGESVKVDATVGDAGPTERSLEDPA